MSTSETSETPGLRALAAQVARLTHQGLELEEFYQRFIDLLPVPPATLGTAAWLKQGNAFRSIAKGSRNPLQGVQLPYSNEQHADLLGRVANHGTWEIVAPRRPEDFQPVMQNSVPAIAVFPVIRGGETAYLVEVFLPPELADDEMRRFAVQTEMLCGVGSAYHAAPALPSTTPHAPSVTGVFTQEIHRSLSSVETAYAIANEGRNVIGCDRLSVLIRRGKRYKVQSASSTDDVNPRANLIQSLQHLVERTMAVGEPFWYPVPNFQVPPEIEEALERYIEVSMCRTLGIVPLFAAPPRQLDGDAPDSAHAQPPQTPIGALVVERFSSEETSLTSLQAQTDAAATQSGIALGNALAQEEIFLLPVWKRLGAVQSFLFGSRRAKTFSAMAALVVFAVVLAVSPAELKINSEGRLQPVNKRNVFATWDGTVDTLHVHHGDNVEQGSVLAELRSEQIALDIRRLQGEIATNQSRLDAIRAQRLTATPSSERQNDAMDDAAVEQQDLERLLQSLRDQLVIQERKQKQLEVTSPLSGQVLTWDLEELLQDRPVRRGQFLMEVADLAGPWRLELDLPDRRTMHVLRAAQRSADPLQVSFLLASEPKARYVGRVTEIVRATSVDPEVGQYVRVHVAIDAETIPFKQPGTKIQAKIHCGQRKLGYVWFHQVWEFLQSRVLFRIT